MSKYTGYIIAIVVLSLIILLYFVRAYTTGESLEHHIRGTVQSGIGFLRKIPQTQLFLYAIIGTIIGCIGLYHALHSTSGLPTKTLHFMKDKPLDGRSLFKYKSSRGGTTTGKIPSELIEVTNNDQFSYGFWIYISGADNNILDGDSDCGPDWIKCNFGKWKHILHHGTPSYTRKNSQQVPGIWLAPLENNMIFVVNSSGNAEMITLDDISLNKWVHITVTLHQRNISVFQNGELLKTIVLQSQPVIQSNWDLYVGNSGGGSNNEEQINNGFAGLLYLGFYTNTILSPKQIKSVYEKEKGKIKDYYTKVMYKRIYQKK